jgi:predicted nucleotidyltransferase
MSIFLAELKRVARDLNESAVPWCLVGGLATSVYTEPRTTKDVDLVVSVSGDPDSEQLRAFLKARGYTGESMLLHALPTFKMGWRLMIPPSNGVNIPIDILSSVCGFEGEIIQAAEKFEILPGVVLPVASLGHLMAMKIISQNNTDRIQDRADLLALLKAAKELDVSLARGFVARISGSLYANDRDLVAEFDSLRNSVSGQ